MNLSFKKILPYAGMIIAVIIVGYLARQNHNSFEKTIVNQARRQLLQAVRIEGRLLNQRVSNLTRELEILSENTEVQAAFLSAPSSKNNPGFTQLDDSYKDVKSLADSLSMIDAKGIVICEAPIKKNTGKDLSSEADVRKVLDDRRVFASGVIKTASGESILVYDQPVFKQGKFVGLLKAVIRLETLQAFVSRHEGEDYYSFLLDQEGFLLSYFDTHYLGKNLLTLFSDNNLSLKESRLETFLDGLGKGVEGSGEYRLLPVDSPHKAEDVIAAFSPISFGGNMWSLVTVEDYDSISGPVNRNARDNIVFGGLIVLALFLSGTILYQDQRRKNNELRATQSLLIQSAKMEVVGKLAAGVAHEVKNPLAIILMNAGYLKDNVKTKDENISSALEDIMGSICRADTIVKGLLDFSSISKLEIETLDIHSLIDKALLLVKYTREKNNIRLAKNFAKDVPAVSVDKNKIEQVFLNLFMNAIQAMPSGGELKVSTFQAGASDKRQMVMVQIEDSGAGLTEIVMNNMFIPFVTTKHSSGGTGLGLSIVKNIMEMHEGKITLENKTKDSGVRATLWFKTGGKA